MNVLSKGGSFVLSAFSVALRPGGGPVLFLFGDEMVPMAFPLCLACAVCGRTGEARCVNPRTSPQWFAFASSLCLPLPNCISKTRKFGIGILIIALSKQANVSASQVRENYPSENGDY